jgi:hypothetical protein|nr:MAG TPA: hypothetical protein [Caudoviricetes sp.]
MEIIDLRKTFGGEELRNFMRVFSDINRQVDLGDKKHRWDADDDLITAPMLMWGDDQIASMFVSINRLYDKNTHEMVSDLLRKEESIGYQVESLVYTFNLSSCIAIGNRSIKVIDPEGGEYYPNYLSMSSSLLHLINEEGDKRKVMVVTYSYGKYASKTVSTQDNIAMEACKRSVLFSEGNFLNDTIDNISALIQAFKLNQKKDYKYVMAETLWLPEVVSDNLSDYAAKKMEEATGDYEHDPRLMTTLATIPSLIMRYSPEALYSKKSELDDEGKPTSMLN